MCQCFSRIFPLVPPNLKSTIFNTHFIQIVYNLFGVKTCYLSHVQINSFLVKNFYIITVTQQDNTLPTAVIVYGGVEYSTNGDIPFNVGYGESFSVKDIVIKIVKESRKNLSVRHDLSKPSINTKLSLNSKKAYELLGWKSKVSIDEGIKKTIKWYKENI